MPSVVIEILHWPLFPIVIVALIAVLYWRGFLAARNRKRDQATPDARPQSSAKPGDNRKP